ncbi:MULTISPECIES: response regulator transcription factor [unclassified Leptolyngbya]|uniref:response regulator n=1 Tax=unclassified Leptolyngbya TaxID=2650499 RepID=UPI001686DCEA|nr:MULTISPECIES: response regulator transcription factor [unclassified Leptolyngbya]MBD1911320.1 response regulator transcription factor [Leptolyngbya sp. FACHB-8]MBD2156662.1 response regulator transcription factor [Leptolyngbya sp. FACHB-16]
MIRLLIVDDQHLIRQGLRTLLEMEADIEVVGEADTGEKAVQQAVALHPDVVLMDIRMPEMDGVAATEIICRQTPASKVLVLTTFDDDDYVTAALRQGAVGYLLKDTPSETLADAIRAAHQGYTQLSPGILTKLTVYLNTPSTPPPPPELQHLTPREREVLKLIATGASNREIAEALYLSEGTVKNHVTNLLARLNLRDRTQAALFAQTHRDAL